MIGQSLTYQVGMLRYPSTVSTVAAAVTVPIVVIAVLVIVGVFVFVHRRNHNKGYVLRRDLMHTEFGWAVGKRGIAHDLFWLFTCVYN